MATHNLKGNITDPNNKPLAKLSVRASAAGKLLGETSTDQNGAYHIAYPAKQVVKGASIQVEVFDVLGRRIGQGELVVSKATSKLDLVVEIEQYAPTKAFTAALQQDLAQQKRVSTAMAAVGKTTKAALSPTISESSALAVLPKIAPFLEANPDFDLLEQNVDTFLDTRTTSTRALDAAETNDDLKAQLKSVQRVFRLQPTFEGTKSLLEQDFHSAQKIFAAGEQNFVRSMKDLPGFSEESARATFQKAANTNAAVLSMVAEWRDIQDAQSIAALRTTQTRSIQSKGILPNMQTLFGAMDICECAHCRSVLSPSAYLMDLISFLKNRSTGISGAANAWELLKSRRPDIGFLEMSCDNTNVPLPYIDLVNEVLEETISTNLEHLGEKLPIANEAALSPNGKVSAELVAAFKAIGLPLSDQALVSKRTRFGGSNTTIYDYWLVRDEQASYKIVLDFLKDSSTFYVSPLRQTRGSEAWLKAAPQYVNPSVYSLGLSKAVYPMTMPFHLFLEETRAYLQQVGMERWELMETVQSKEPAKVAEEYFHFDPALWNATRFHLWNYTDPAHFSTHKVDNILQKSGLDYSELLQIVDLRWINPNRAISVMHQDNSCDVGKKRMEGEDETFYDRVPLLVRLSRLTGWTYQEMDLAIIHPKIGNGTFDQQFLINLMAFSEIKKALYLSIEETLALFGDLNTETYFSAAYAPRTEGLYQRLFLNPRNAPPADFALENLANPTAKLSEFTFYLQTVLQLSATELDLLLNLKRHDGTPYLPSQALNLDNLSFLYRNTLLARRLDFPTLHHWSAFLQLNQVALDGAKGLFKELSSSRKALKTFAEAANFFLSGVFSPDELAYVLTNKTEGVGIPSKTEIGEFLSNLKKTLNALTGVEVKKEGTQIEDKTAQIEDFIVQQFSEKLGLNPALAAYIFEKIPFPSKTLQQLAIFSNPDIQVPDTTDFNKAIAAFYWWHRVALLVQKLGITLAEMTALINLQGKEALIIQLQKASATAAIPFESLLSLQEVLNFSRQYTIDKTNFWQIQSKLKGKNLSIPNDIALLFDSKAADVQTLMANPHSVYIFNGKGIASWKQLEKALSWCKKLNIPAQKLKNQAEPSLETLTDLKQSLRPLYAETQWLQLTQTIQDNLRERKRDALVAYLLTQSAPPNSPSGKWQHANDLYAYYLIDVEMSAVQPTSRIVQAAATIQLFVQRCLMGLEPQVVVDTEGTDADMGWQEWKWMKNYRVWEANRKVFLYPENWIEPELRPNKTPLFKELENELAQNELNRENAETVFLNYLEKLEGIAHLEPMGHCWQEETNTFHVFARTMGEPHQYYYRKFEESRRWTAWTKVELDIQGEYLVPFVGNGRVYLFWTQFMEVPNEEANKNVAIPKQGEPYPMQRPVKNLLMNLAYSYLQNGKWSPKKISKEGIKIGVFEDTVNPRKGISIVVRDSSIVGLENNSDIHIACALNNGQNNKAVGNFIINGYKGTPVPIDFFAIEMPKVPTFSSAVQINMQLIEKNSVPLSVIDGFINTSTVLNKTDQNQFRISQSWQQTPIDNYYANNNVGSFAIYVGNNMPYFYQDGQRTFWVSQKWSNAETGKVFDIKAFSTFARKFIPLDQKMRTVDKDLKSGKITADQARQIAIDWDMVLRENIHFTSFGLFDKGNFQVNPKTSFITFHHPFVPIFNTKIENGGIGSLLNRSTQLQINEWGFKTVYNPDERLVSKPYPREDVDFSPDGSYSIYNWELFFHAPLMIATRLAKNQRFEEALEWFHYIFNPLDPSPKDTTHTAQKYWVTKPFFERQSQEYDHQRIDVLLKKLAGDKSSSIPADDPTLNPPFSKEALELQVADWRKHPFEPHIIAEYRTVAYQKTVIMKYLDTLIAWGDQLFRQDTMESINEATQLYIIAAEMLGQRPRRIPPSHQALPLTFHELEVEMDDFSNSVVRDLENLVPAVPSTNTQGTPPPPNILYFCLPPNEKLLGYWDTVENRLYNIRHGRNIEGIQRALALFAPPIDPAALVKAVAGGASVGAGLNDLNTPTPHYRFAVALQKANELCSDVKSLGGALLAALEKKDGEVMGLLRQTHEMAVLEAVRGIKLVQVEDAKLSFDGLRKSKELITIRRDYYSSREFLNREEQISLKLNEASTALDASIAIGYTLAGGLFLIPGFILGISGFGGSPHGTAESGGKSMGDSGENAVKTISAIAHAFDKAANVANTVASYKRRKEEWEHQIKLANKELEQIEKSLASAELKIRIAEQELKNHNLQVKNARSIDEYMRTKYTNQELYEWQVSQISQVYFQTYQLAYDWARKAEKCYQFELGKADKIIQFGHWDSLKKGLLSGEKLQLDLRRLEAAYLEQNKRDFEITKHISLNQLNPIELLNLRETGVCKFTIPEELYDLDFPGHYFRRIKSVSISLPCIAGPYTSVNATLKLQKNSVRVKNTGNYPRDPNNNDGDFHDDVVGIQSIATSSGQNDSGLFELNFRDERYLPFEGAGAISEWTLEMMAEQKLRQFDYHTIADVIVHIRYTAREDGNGDKGLKGRAIAHLRNITNKLGEAPLARLFSLHHDFPNEWHRHVNGDSSIMNIQLEKHHFPYWVQIHAIKINRFTIISVGGEVPDHSQEALDNLTLSNQVPSLNLPIPMPVSEQTKLTELYVVVEYALG